jgi:hypothetical protein
MCILFVVQLESDFTRMLHAMDEQLAHNRPLVAEQESDLRDMRDRVNGLSGQVDEQLRALRREYEHQIPWNASNRSSLQQQVETHMTQHRRELHAQVAEARGKINEHIRRLEQKLASDRSVLQQQEQQRVEAVAARNKQRKKLQQEYDEVRATLVLQRQQALGQAEPMFYRACAVFLAARVAQQTVRTVFAAMWDDGGVQLVAVHAEDHDRSSNGST